MDGHAVDDVRATPTTSKNRFMTSYVTRFARSPAANFLVFTSGKRFTAVSLRTGRWQPAESNQTS